MGSVAVRLGYRPPYDWDSILSFLRARAIPGIEVVSNDRYARTVAIGGERGTVVVEPANTGLLKATVRFPNLGSLPAIIARIGNDMRMPCEHGVRTATACGMRHASCVVVWLLVKTWRGFDWIRAAAWAGTGLLLATSWLLPWYLVWPLPLAAVARDRALAFVLLALTAYQLGARIPL